MSNTHTHTLAVNLSGKHFPVTLKAWELCYFKFELFTVSITPSIISLCIYIYTQLVFYCCNLRSVTLLSETVKHRHMRE